MNDLQNNNFRDVYQQLCNSYRAIDDFRAKLLGFLPLVSGTGIFILMSNIADIKRAILFPVGIFGFIVTLGLFAFEIYGILKCTALIKTGKNLETNELETKVGQFTSRPGSLINEPFAAGTIYPAVLAAWMYLAIFNPAPDAVLDTMAMWPAIIIFATGFIGMLIFNLWLLLKK